MKNQLLKLKLRELSKLFFEVNNLWEDSDDDTYEEMSKNYPFADSFDDLAFKVKEWVDFLEENI